MQTKTLDILPNHCYPIDLQVNLNDLIHSVEILLERLGLNLAKINEYCRSAFGFTVNLTHLPGLTGEDRWRKYNGNHPSVVKQGVHERDFTEHIKESQDLLIGQLVHDIYNYHEGQFQGRAQLIWLGARKSYDFHRDLHTPNRYHVPLLTNEQCYWLLKKNDDIYKLHMPADGRVWYLDPIGVEHTFCNESSDVRLHVLLTSGY